MDERVLEKFKRNSGQGGTYKIGKDDFNLKPFPVGRMPELMYLMQLFNNKDSSPDELKTTMNKMLVIIDEFLSFNYPDMPRDVQDDFIRDNFFQLGEVLFEAHSTFFNSLSDKQKENIKKLAEQFDKQNEKSIV